jgi:hypothetical protein
MSYIINNPWPSWIETYECYAHQLMCGVFLFLYDIRYDTFEGYVYSCFHNVGVKKLYSNLVKLHENDVSF